MDLIDLRRQSGSVQRRVKEGVKLDGIFIALGRIYSIGLCMHDCLQSDVSEVAVPTEFARMFDISHKPDSHCTKKTHFAWPLPAVTGVLVRKMHDDKSVGAGGGAKIVSLLYPADAITQNACQQTM